MTTYPDAFCLKSEELICIKCGNEMLVEVEQGPWNEEQLERICEITKCDRCGDRSLFPARELAAV